METHSKLLPISIAINFQSPRLCLADNKGRQWVYYNEILYVKADGKYTDFYILDPSQQSGLRIFKATKNLGSFAYLCDKHFAQPRENIYFNLHYLVGVSKESTVQLRFPEHELIAVTPTFRAAMNAAIDAFME